MTTRKPEPARFACPHCGASVPSGAPACPRCGSDDETGWSRDTMYDDLDLPDPEFRHTRPKAVESQPAVRRSKAGFWRVVAVVVLLLLGLLILTGRW